MKKYIYLSVILFLSIAGFAQSGDEAKITAAAAALNKAIIDADKTALQSLTAEELSYGHSTGKIENKAEFVEALVSGKVDLLSIDISDQTIKLAGNNAIVRHKFSGKVSNEGKPPVDVNIGVVMVWVKLNSEWKLLARQGYKL